MSEPPAKPPEPDWEAWRRSIREHDARLKRRSKNRRGREARQTVGHARGEAHYAARLTDATVRAIRSRHGSGEPRGALAAEFGITPRMVNLICARKRWAHVED